MTRHLSGYYLHIKTINYNEAVQHHWKSLWNTYVINDISLRLKRTLRTSAESPLAALRHGRSGHLDSTLFLFFFFFFNLWRIRSFSQTTLIQSVKLGEEVIISSQAKAVNPNKKLRRVNRRGTFKGLGRDTSAGVVIGEWETGAWVDSGDWDRWKSLRAPGGQMENAGALKLVLTCLET